MPNAAMPAIICGHSLLIVFAALAIRRNDLPIGLEFAILWQTPQRKRARACKLTKSYRISGVNGDAKRGETNYRWRVAMNTIRKFAIAAALLAVAGLANQPMPHAEEAHAVVTLKPMSGPGASGKNQPFLLDTKVGTKQAVSYFFNEDGLCRLTVMVAEAFNGEDVPLSTTVRFDVAIGDGERARMDTAEGKSLEFACQAHAQELVVRAEVQIPAYPSGT
jgi:hypothetical protein